MPNGRRGQPSKEVHKQLPAAAWVRHERTSGGFGFTHHLRGQERSLGRVGRCGGSAGARAWGHWAICWTSTPWTVFR